MSIISMPHPRPSIPNSVLNPAQSLNLHLAPHRHRRSPKSCFHLQLVLIPTMESVSIFQGENGRTRLDDFKRLDCERPHIRVNHIPPTIDPVCRKLHFSGSAVIYDGALCK